MLTRTRSQDDGDNPPPGTGGGLVPEAPVIWVGSSGVGGSKHRQGRPGFSRGKVQARDCTLRPQEGTESCQGGLSALATLWAWRDTTDILFLPARPHAMRILYVGYPQNCDIRPGFRMFSISGFSGWPHNIRVKSKRPSTISPSAVARYVKAMAATGWQPGPLIMRPDGSVVVLPLGAAIDDESGPNPCDRLLKGGMT